MRKNLVGIAVAALFMASPAYAGIDSYVALMNGANEVPGPGDPDGIGIGTLVIDNVANTVSWSFLVNSIALPLTGAHIHTGAAGVAGGVIVSFSSQLSGNGLADADLAMITPVSAPNFYLNLHNGGFPGGAIRGQLQYVGSVAAIPEPSTYALMLAGMGVVGLLARRRRTDA